jgi:hypothetical protein
MVEKDNDINKLKEYWDVCAKWLGQRKSDEPLLSVYP